MPIFFGKISRDTGVAWYVERDGSIEDLKKAPNFQGLSAAGIQMFPTRCGKAC